MRGSAPRPARAAFKTFIATFLVVALVLCLAIASQALGLHFAIGAFFGAMMITRDLLGDPRFEALERQCGRATAVVFGPLFLAFQGIKLQLHDLGQPAFLLGLLAVAVFSKLFAGYVVGRLRGMSTHDAWGIGIIMNARGVMEMVVASIAYKAGLVDGALFSALLLVGVITSVLTPVLLKRWLTEAKVSRLT